MHEPAAWWTLVYGGYSIDTCCRSGVDAVDIALEQLRADFGSHNAVQFNPGTVVPATGSTVHPSTHGTARIICGDFLQTGTTIGPDAPLFSVVYDKDAFGAIQPELRSEYTLACAQMCQLEAHVLVEGKDKPDSEGGPPFHLDAETVQRHWGAAGFELVEYFPSLYPIARPGWKQQGFLLKLKGR